VGGLARAAGRRIAWLLATAALTVVLVHGLVVVAPGGAADAAAAGPGDRAALAASWAEEAPAVTRIARGIGRTLQGDLGTSRVVKPGAPVTPLALGAWSRSAARLLAALGVATLLAVAGAMRRRRVGLASSVASATPVFLLALAAVTSINAATWWLVSAGWIDRPSWFALPDAPSLWREVLGVTILAVASSGLSELRRDVAGALAAYRDSPWADAARTRGEPQWPHLLTNLTAPVARALSARAVLLAGGLVVLEKVLLLQGAGGLLWRAAVARDLPLAAGVALVGAGVIAAIRLGLDLLALRADPRLMEAS
jgi:peptide/nickel transport system permease protein